MTCNQCGGSMIGDGNTEPMRCENANQEDWDYLEPDSNPVECNGEFTKTRMILRNTPASHPYQQP